MGPWVGQDWDPLIGAENVTGGLPEWWLVVYQVTRPLHIANEATSKACQSVELN